MKKQQIKVYREFEDQKDYIISTSADGYTWWSSRFTYEDLKEVHRKISTILIEEEKG